MAPDRDQPLHDPRCPVCFEPVRSGDIVLFMHGDLLHIECRTSPASTTERVAEFLRRQPDATYCNVCIGTACSLVHYQVVKAVTQLRLRSDFRLMVGERCTGCDQRRITIGIRSTQGTPEPIRG